MKCAGRQPMRRVANQVVRIDKGRNSVNRLIPIAVLAALLVAGCGKPASPPPAPAATAPTPSATAGATPAGAAIAPLDDTKALAIMAKAGCAACHAIDK